MTSQDTLLYCICIILTVVHRLACDRNSYRLTKRVSQRFLISGEENLAVVLLLLGSLRLN